MLDGLHWERGYRCWGLWTAGGVRVAAVGLGPPGHARVVTWGIAGTDIAGDARRDTQRGVIWHIHTGITI